MNTPLFSIIIPTYNRPIELERAVNSALTQTFSDYEIIIVDNGTVAVNNKYESDKITIVKEEKRGGNYARNTGITLSNGKYICFLDDDDEYQPNHLQVLFDLIEENNFEVGLYRTLTKIENSFGNYANQDFVFCSNQEQRLNYALKYLVFMASVCLPKTITDKFKFDPLITIAQDYHLWLRILADYPMLESNKVTTIYHYSAQSVSKPNKERYYEYIKVYSNLFNIKSIGSKISNKTKRDRIFKYYFWLLSGFKMELTYIEYITVLIHIIYYNPKFLFEKELYAAALK